MSITEVVLCGTADVLLLGTAVTCQ